MEAGRRYPTQDTAPPSHLSNTTIRTPANAFFRELCMWYSDAQRNMAIVWVCLNNILLHAGLIALRGQHCWAYCHALESQSHLGDQQSAITVEAWHPNLTATVVYA